MFGRPLKIGAGTLFLCAAGAVPAGASRPPQGPPAPHESTHFELTTPGLASQRLEREVLRTLETWYHRYLVLFESEPDEPIPVVLYSRVTFHGTTGAPPWADGVYDSDGAIHAAIGGMARVGDDLERLLAHELAHAFIDHLSGGHAPRWLQEGLAQALADDRPTHDAASPRPGVNRPDLLDYEGTLLFTRHLLSLHATAVLRDALADMGKGLSPDVAIKNRLGATPAELLAAWSRPESRLARQSVSESAP